MAHDETRSVEACTHIGALERPWTRNGRQSRDGGEHDGYGPWRRCTAVHLHALLRGRLGA